MIGRGRDTALFQEIYRLLHARDGRLVDDYVAFVVSAHQRLQQAQHFSALALFGHVTQIGAVEAGNVFVRVTQLKLVEDVVTDPLGGAGGESGDVRLRESFRAGVSAGGSPGEIRVPTRRCSGLRRWRKKIRGHCAARLWCFHWPAAPGKYRADGILLRAL